MKQNVLMKLLKTKIKDLQIIKTKIFKDRRGFLKEVFRENLIKNKKFIFNIMSFSKKNVLRGLHIQSKNSQAKIITVSHGKIFDVAVDLRKKSKTFGKYFSIILSDKNSKSIYIPKGFAHGFMGMDKENYVVYSNSNYRSKKNELGIIWNDKNLKIKWPTKNPLVSKKDKNNLTFKEFCKIHLKN